MAEINLANILLMFSILICLLDLSTGIVGCVRANVGDLSLRLGVKGSTTMNVNGGYAIFFSSVALIILSAFTMVGELNPRIVTNVSIMPQSTYFKSFLYAIMAILCLGLAGDLGFASMIITLVYLVFFLIVRLAGREKVSTGSNP